MKETTIIILALYCCHLYAFEAYEADYVDGDSDLADYLREAIENFRVQMTKGIPEIRMPVLDPLMLRNMDINLNENVATMDLHIQECTVRGLSSFILHHINPDLENFYLQLNFTFPVLNVDGIYDMKGRIYKVFPIDGNGEYKVNASNIYMGGSGKLGFINETLQVELLEFDLIWDKTHINFENFLGNGSFSEVMHRLIPDVGREVYTRYKSSILRPLENYLKKQINNELQKPSVKDIIKGILPMAK